MQIIYTIAAMRQWRQQMAGRVAFVPTMGNLHEGHLALIEAARQCADNVVVSIFVNRLQFGQEEDFDAYPRTFDNDCALLRTVEVAVVFAPSEKELYPRVQEVKVEPPPIQHEICGAFRRGHFQGVATIVAKLFNIVQPQVACFGKKDYQQLYIIQLMVNDLNLPVTIVPVNTGRAHDGLALSSRNRYLTVDERARAPRLYCNLLQIRERLLAGQNDYAQLERVAWQDLVEAGWTVDYIEVRQADTLEKAALGEQRLVVLAAAWLGRTRLIDNVEIMR